MLALIDFATQLLLVLLGFALIFSPHVLRGEYPLGRRADVEQFFLAIPVAMIAYTGIETVSNLAEEARDPVENIPRAISFVAIAVFAIYFTLPLIALSALPVTKTADGQYQTLLGLGPPEGFSNDPVLGLVENLGVHGAALSALKVYVGMLAATILFIATNAGVIGASRITYAMASYRQLPEVFRRLHTRFKTPCISLLVLRGRDPDRSCCCRARRTSSARCTRSARCSRSRSRTPRSSRCAYRRRDDELHLSRSAQRAPARSGLAAVRGLRRARDGARPGSSWSSRKRPRAGRASAGSWPDSPCTRSTGAGSCTSR